MVAESDEIGRLAVLKQGNFLLRRDANDLHETVRPSTANGRPSGLRSARPLWMISNHQRVKRGQAFISMDRMSPSTVGIAT
jgi:hypothetical protein